MKKTHTHNQYIDTCSSFTFDGKAIRVINLFTEIKKLCLLFVDGKVRLDWFNQRDERGRDGNASLLFSPFQIMV